MTNVSRKRKRDSKNPELDQVPNELDRIAQEGRRRPVTIFYSPAYWAETPEFDTFRKSYWIERRLTTGSGLERDFFRFEEPDGLYDTDLETVHAATYLTAVRTGSPRELAGSNGFDWTPGIYGAAECSSQGIAQAAVRALETRQPAGSLSAGLHHARADRGAGFCTFNGLALAARAAIDARAGAVLILDFDAHFGGGTWSIVSSWKQVWHVDVSVSDFDAYDPKGHARSVTRHVTDGVGYLDAVRRALDQVAGTTFDLVIYNAGMDVFEGCATGGLRGVTKQILDLREQLVFDWARAKGVPVAFALAGGYTGPDVSVDDLVNLHLLTIDAANPGRPVLASADHLRTGCPIDGLWRTWDFLNLPKRELPHKSTTFNRSVSLGPLEEPLAIVWERGTDDALHRPPTLEESNGAAWRFEHGSPAHIHADVEVDGRSVHFDCVRGTKYGPGRSWTEIVAFVDGECMAHGWTGGCALGFGGTRNLPLSVRVTNTATLVVDNALRVVLRRDSPDTP